MPKAESYISDAIITYFYWILKKLHFTSNKRYFNLVFG